MRRYFNVVHTDPMPSWAGNIFWGWRLKKQLSDWRNIALVIAALIILGGIIRQLSLSAETSNEIVLNRQLAKVNDRVIYESDLMKELKNEYGTQVLISMIDLSMLDNYARKKGIIVTDADVDQLLGFQRLMMELKGTTLEKVLEEQKLTLESVKQNFRRMAMQIRVVVPEQDIAAEIQRDAQSLTYPPRYRLHRMIFLRKEDAQKAVDALKQNATLDVAVVTALNAEEARKPMLYVPLGRQSDPLLNKALQGLKPGECSQPYIIPVGKEAKGGAGKEYYGVVLLKEAFPEEKPTMRNRNLIAGQMLISSDRKYMEKITGLEGKLVQQSDWRFLSEQFPDAKQHFEDIKLRNPDIPGFNEETPAGGPATAPPSGSKPAPTGAPKPAAPTSGAPASTAPAAGAGTH